MSSNRLLRLTWLALGREIDILRASSMPKIKMKSNSSAKKRFKLTAKGRVKRKHAYLRHNLTERSRRARSESCAVAPTSARRKSIRSKRCSLYS